MTRRVTPMIHVPDVRATVAWYESIGFEVLDTGELEGEMVGAGGLHGAPTLSESEHPVILSS